MPAESDDDDFLIMVGRCGAMACAAWSADEGADLPELRLLRALWRLADPVERTALAAAVTRAFARDDEWW